jgi:Zn-dependent peptidase ImmA (M78 family)
MQLMNYIEKTDEWEQRAYKVLARFNWNNPDEIDMYDICWRYGVNIKPLDVPFLEDNIDYQSIKHLKAFSVPKSKARRGTIYLDPGLNTIEKKLILAEEFCHVYSHFNSQLDMDKHYLHKIENQAKRMAAYLIMPAKFIDQIYSAAINEPVLVSDIADHFLVTEDFAHYRLALTFKHRIDGFALLKNRLGSIEWYN